MYKKYIIAIIVAMLFVSGVTSFVISRNTAPVDKEDHAIAQTELEFFLKEHNANSQIAAAYRFAQENPQGVLSKVKCYCGCIKNQRHKSNRDCFLSDDGSFDLMGLNCGLCVKTALLSKEMLAKGKTVAEISLAIDEQFGKIQ